MSDKDPVTRKLTRPSAHPPQGTEASSVLVLLPLVLVIACTVAWYAMNEHTSPAVVNASHVEAAPHVESAAELEPEPEPEPEPATAPATPATGTPRRESNVSGAKGSLASRGKGAKPLDRPNVSPDRQESQVSADSQEARAETREVERDKSDVETEQASPLVVMLNEKLAVKHKHRVGSCEGVLRVSADKLEYETSHKDAFSVALSDVARFSREKETLSVKVRDGRNYNFNERNEDHPALASFHERVAPALATKN